MSTQNNLFVENLQLLDNALDYLAQSETLSLHIDDLRVKLIKETDKKLELINTDNKSVEDLFNDIFTTQSQKTKNLVKISEVLLFLEAEKLIRLIEQNHIRITYQGVIQHSKGYLATYTSELTSYQRLRNVENVQKFHLRWMSILTSIIAFGTLVASIYYFFEIFSVRFCICR